MKNLPIGIQTFSKIITENYLYIDKTALIYELITKGSCYFLSRPRRFGKSLLISTLESIFSNQKELFEGLAISLLPYNWKKYPVITLSMSDIACTTTEEFNNNIKIYLHRLATKQYGVNLDMSVSTGQMLRDLVIELADQAPVVLLIDEYDYPIVKHIKNPLLAEEIRSALRSFYDVIKGLDRYLKFTFLTGVSQFSKTSIFSGLNNLEDISLSEKYNCLLGYTKDEITHHCNEWLHSVADKKDSSIETLLDEITVWYDGYRFCRPNNATPLYNPFSVLSFLKNSDFSNYWFKTGTPTFLINALKVKDYSIQDFESIQATESELSTFEIDTLQLKTLLFQTGYITIKNYNAATGNYTLGHANKETIDSLAESIFPVITNLSATTFNNSVLALSNAFHSNDMITLQSALEILYASIPYTIQIEQERYYQTIFYLILKMLNAHIIVEHATNIGRIDAVLETKDTTFIIEFKINSSAKEAIEQIENTKYAQQYQLLDKKIVIIGISFDTKKRNIGELLHKIYKE